MISKSLEEYLKTMYILNKQNGNIRVTDIAKKMITVYGMSDNIGPIGLNLDKDPYQLQLLGDKIEDKIDKKEIKEIMKDCGALLIYKINSAVLKATDNIIISAFLGLAMVGIYSNYYILYTTIKSIINKIYDAVGHSLGNLHTINDKNK